MILFITAAANGVFVGRYTLFAEAVGIHPSRCLAQLVIRNEAPFGLPNTAFLPVVGRFCTHSNSRTVVVRMNGTVAAATARTAEFATDESVATSDSSLAVSMGRDQFRSWLWKPLLLKIGCVHCRKRTRRSRLIDSRHEYDE